MSRVRMYLVAAVAASGLLGAASPALGRAPEPPAPLPTADTRGARVATSAPGVVDFDFAATHVVFSWRGDDGAILRYRPELPSARWRPVHEAHDLEDGDVHFSGVLDVSGASAVSWGFRRHGDARDVRVTYIDAGAFAAPSDVTQTTADPSDPTIVTRREWGADESLKRTGGSCERQFFPVQQLFVHHTAGTNNVSDPAATMRAIYWFHVVDRGWCDVAYNFVIAPDGRIFEGRWARPYASWEAHTSEDRRGRSVMGGHTSGRNSGSVGISMMGNFSQIQVPPAARSSLVNLLAWEADRHGLDPTGSHTYVNPQTGLRDSLPFIAGHRDGGQTECPGNYLYADLPEVRADVDAIVDAKTPSRLTLSAQSTKVDRGEPVTFSGALTAGGAPVVGRPVEVFWRYKGGSWRRGAPVTTSADGTYEFTLVPDRNVAARTVYRGDSATWGTFSRAAASSVRPLVSLHATGGAPPVAGLKTYPSDTSAITFYGRVRPAHPQEPVTLHVHYEPASGAPQRIVKAPLTLSSESRYRYTWNVPSDAPGRTYKIVVWFGGDHDHSAARSAPLRVLFEPL